MIKITPPKTPLVTVDAIILYKGNFIILIRRRNPPFKGELALPGRFVDLGETVEEACSREAYEETNLHINIIKLVGVLIPGGMDAVRATLKYMLTVPKIRPRAKTPITIRHFTCFDCCIFKPLYTLVWLNTLIRLDSSRWIWCPYSYPAHKFWQQPL